MKMIEERAVDACDNIPYNVYIHSSVNCEDAFKDGYIKGAAEQKAIDIDKACKAHCSCCMAYSACSRCGKFGCWELDKIRKAMEE